MQMRCYCQSGQSLGKGRDGKMQADFRYIFVTNWGGNKEKRSVYLFLMSNCMNGRAIYESGSNQGERDLERKIKSRSPVCTYKFGDACPSFKCRCQVSSWICKSSSNGRI